MSQEGLLFHLLELLDSAGIPRMLVGAYASSLRGWFRATQDIDLVIDPSPDQLDFLLSALGEEFYVSQTAAREALQARSQFNIVHLESGWKADLIIRKDRPFSREEFARRSVVEVEGHQIEVASPEDIILSKLEWSKLSDSERQYLDALNVAQIHRDHLDRDYLSRWAPELRVEVLLNQLLGELDQEKEET